jgi:hypothetical protein
MQTIDILMVTYNSPDSTRLALTRLLETCGEHMRVWLWHNGDHAETLDLVRSFEPHPRAYRFKHSEENVRLWSPTTRLGRRARPEPRGRIAVRHTIVVACRFHRKQEESTWSAT